MNKKSQKATKQTNNLCKFLNKPDQNDFKNTSSKAPKTEGKKKLSNSNHSHSNSKDKLPSPPILKKYTLPQLTKLFDM